MPLFQCTACAVLKYVVASGNKSNLCGEIRLSCGFLFTFFFKVPKSTPHENSLNKKTFCHCMPNVSLMVFSPASCPPPPPPPLPPSLPSPALLSSVCSSKPSLIACLFLSPSSACHRTTCLPPTALHAALTSLGAGEGSGWWRRGGETPRVWRTGDLAVV